MSAAAVVVSAARSAGLIGRTGRNAGEASHPASAAGGTKTPSVTQVPEMHVVVERRAEAVQERDAAEPRASGCGGVGVSCDACRSAQQPLDLIKKDLRQGGDGRMAVGKHAPPSLRHGDHPLPHGHRRDDVIGEMRRGL